MTTINIDRFADEPEVTTIIHAAYEIKQQSKEVDNPLEQQAEYEAEQAR